MLVPNGLNNKTIPNWGSWGGRYELYKPEPLKTSIPEVFTGGGPYEPEAGTYKGNVSFGMLAENLYNVHTIKAPNVEKPETVHFILRVTDKGNPPLSRYQRVIVTITPK